MSVGYFIFAFLSLPPATTPRRCLAFFSLFSFSFLFFFFGPVGGRRRYINSSTQLFSRPSLRRDATRSRKEKQGSLFPSGFYPSDRGRCLLPASLGCKSTPAPRPTPRRKWLPVFAGQLAIHRKLAPLNGNDN